MIICVITFLKHTRNLRLEISFTLELLLAHWLPFLRRELLSREQRERSKLNLRKLSIYLEWANVGRDSDALPSSNQRPPGGTGGEERADRRAPEAARGARSAPGHVATGGHPICVGPRRWRQLGGQRRRGRRHRALLRGEWKIETDEKTRKSRDDRLEFVNHLTP